MPTEMPTLWESLQTAARRLYGQVTCSDKP